MRPECDLEVRGRIRLELAKLKIWQFSVGSGKFDIGVGMEFQKLEWVRSVICDVCETFEVIQTWFGRFWRRLRNLEVKKFLGLNPRLI